MESEGQKSCKGSVVYVTTEEREPVCANAKWGSYTLEFCSKPGKIP